MTWCRRDETQRAVVASEGDIMATTLEGQEHVPAESSRLAGGDSVPVNGHFDTV